MTPPSLARWLLERAVAPARRRRAGDLDELFALEGPHAPRRARAAYWRRTLGALWHLSAWRMPPPAAPPHGRSRDDDRSERTSSTGSRLFVTHPGYAWAAVVTLALAIGANTVIFSIANVLVLKPLPFDRPERLGWILVTGPGAGPTAAARRCPTTRPTATRSPPSRSCRPGGGFRSRCAPRSLGARPQPGGGRRPAGPVGAGGGRGRLLSRRRRRSGRRPRDHAQPSLLDHPLGGSDAVLGRDVLLNGRPHTIVGVLSPAIELGNRRRSTVGADRRRSGAGQPQRPAVADGGPARRRRRARRCAGAGGGGRAAPGPRTSRHQPRLDRSGRGHPRGHRRHQYLAGAVAALHRGRAAAGAGLRQHHEPADRPADRPPPGTGRAHRARRHPGPRRRPDRRREPADRPGRWRARPGDHRRRPARRACGRHRAVLPAARPRPPRRRLRLRARVRSPRWSSPSSRPCGCCGSTSAAR